MGQATGYEGSKASTIEHQDVSSAPNPHLKCQPRNMKKLLHKCSTRMVDYEHLSKRIGYIIRSSIQQYILHYINTQSYNTTWN